MGCGCRIVGTTPGQGRQNACARAFRSRVHALVLAEPAARPEQRLACRTEPMGRRERQNAAALRSSRGPVPRRDGARLTERSSAPSDPPARAPRFEQRSEPTPWSLPRTTIDAFASSCAATPARLHPNPPFGSSPCHRGFLAAKLPNNDRHPLPAARTRRSNAAMQHQTPAVRGRTGDERFGLCAEKSGTPPRGRMLRRSQIAVALVGGYVAMQRAVIASAAPCLAAMQHGPIRTYQVSAQSTEASSASTRMRAMYDRPFVTDRYPAQQR